MCRSECMWPHACDVCEQARVYVKIYVYVLFVKMCVCVCVYVCALAREHGACTKQSVNEPGSSRAGLIGPTQISAGIGSLS